MPSPGTPISAYLAAHPQVSMLALAKVAGLHYDTVAKAAKGEVAPAYATLRKLELHAGIPMVAWDGVKIIRDQLTKRVDPSIYAAKQRRYRAGT